MGGINTAGANDFANPFIRCAGMKLNNDLSRHIPRLWFFAGRGLRRCRRGEKRQACEDEYSDYESFHDLPR